MVYQTTSDGKVIRDIKENFSDISSTSSNKLSTPVKIGIVVGSIVGICILAALIKYMYDRYKSNSPNSNQ